MHFGKLFYLGLVFVFIFLTGCDNKKDEAQTVTDKEQGSSVDPVEGENVPRDAFHGFAQGETSPRDPDFHKGTYLDEKVGLERDEEATKEKALKTPDDIIKYFSEILIKNAEDHNAWLMVGSGYMLKNEPKEAIVKFQKGIAVKETPQLQSNLGFAYARLGEYDEAINSHMKALTLNREFANSYYGLAQIFEFKRDVSNALGNWEKYIEFEKKKQVRNEKWVKLARSRIEILTPFVKR